MRFFFKLNIISMLYGFMFVVPVELLLNVYRIDRLMNGDTMNILMIISVSFVLLFSVLIVIVSKYWLRGRFAAIWSALLWFPYCLLFVYIYTRLFPITNQGDVSPPGTGLIVMGGLILYPFYIMIISLLSAQIILRRDRFSRRVSMEYS